MESLIAFLGSLFAIVALILWLIISFITMYKLLSTKVGSFSGAKGKTELEEEYFYSEAFYFAILEDDETCFTLLTKWEFEEGIIIADRTYGYFRINIPFDYENVDRLYFTEELSKEEVRKELLRVGMVENNDILNIPKIFPSSKY